jgi:hypothetical protein
MKMQKAYLDASNGRYDSHVSHMLCSHLCVLTQLGHVRVRNPKKGTQKLVSITNQQQGTAAQSTLCNSVRVCNISRMVTPTHALAHDQHQGVFSFQPEHQTRCRGQQITRATHIKHAIYLPTGKINDNVSAHFIRPAGNIIGPLGAPLPQYRLRAVG